MSDASVLVVGDLMVDRFLWGSVHRISPEAPVPVVHLKSETSVLGGAGNVARNLQSLGANAHLVGVVGSDRGAEEFWRLLDEAGLSREGVVQLKERPTTTKTRVIAQNQQVVRIDRETHGPLPPEVRNEIHVRAGALLSKANGIVISDYEKGVVSEDVLKKVLPAAQAAGLPTAIDPKPPNFPFYKPASVVTPNIHEAREIVGSRGRDEKEIQEMGQILLERLGCDAVLLTRGEEGMTLFEASREPFRIPATAREVFDVTGAGDTVVAVLALCLVAQATMPEAAFLANLAAGLVVGKLGTAIVTQDELISALPGGEMRLDLRCSRSTPP
ncbi:MAG TPA: D-glycero-beta-D-manno-heptose-7-phosphate kinase [Candidatus Polarisedimenticolia bacterium]|nr:D-glycero-beta-D-manno-heptose-7-phosphate kinase [Candidatus Polarisedimenticolia bacterium]